MKVAIAFSTKDRVELSKCSIEPLLEKPFDVFWTDGSSTEEGQAFPLEEGHPVKYIHLNVRGGADAAICYNLTKMLEHPDNYTHGGLVENDVLLDDDWFAPTMELFERGKQDGLNVGAVSARCYEDRILIQREGYAICHNIGAGQVIFSRAAAEIVLQNFRTGWWPTNRRVFAQLSGIDIGHYAAFRTNEQWVTADWHFDAVLASHGYTSLALTPSKCEMIGQEPPLEQQGLKLVKGSGAVLHNEEAFKLYRERLQQRFTGDVHAPVSMRHQTPEGAQLIFPHQIEATGGSYSDYWRLRWSQGYGPFTWEAATSGADLLVPVAGTCSFIVSGGEKGGVFEIRDLDSGYTASPALPPEGASTQVLNLVVPGGVGYRDIRLTAKSPGVRFYGLQTRDPQPLTTSFCFDHRALPPT